ncbi:hypothetical protein CXF83_04290 [Shewanella sp. Choline-02u-19]|uniref:hypothetical protein n=1 Tax=unclassified Shewanella TaxID=196818 RepID=UPI000C338057|nr:MULTISPECIES: hypothetical protein [unclassified Shewanella]PKH55651.1 hypothetical protein CXF84_17785 [Shewanella sp. Bg11-22]PKI29875.1 hypothetical protein CXF83_04290 [Shewanella sp. Choline-02u-19]
MSSKHLSSLLNNVLQQQQNPNNKTDKTNMLDKAVIFITTVSLLSFFVIYETMLDEQLHIQTLLENFLL